MNFSQIDMSMSNSYYNWVEQVAERDIKPVQTTSWLTKLATLFR